MVTPVNDAPAAMDDSFVVDEDSPLSASVIDANDHDPDGDSLAVSLVSGPENASSFTLFSDGSFSYLPAADYFGSDEFVYQVSDGNGAVSNATASIEIQPVNDAAIGLEDRFEALTGEVLDSVQSVLSNDVDIENDALQAVLVSGPSNGTLNFNPDGTFTYVPDPLFVGVDSFTYAATDSGLFAQPTLVEINVDLGLNVRNDSLNPTLSISNDDVEDEVVEPVILETLNESTGSELGETIPEGSQPVSNNQQGDSSADTIRKIVESSDAQVIDLDSLLDPSENLEAVELIGNRALAQRVIGALAENADGRSSDSDDLAGSLPNDLVAIYNAAYLWNELDELGDDEESVFENLNVSIGSVTAFATTGYIFWALRGGVLMATALAQMPSWKLIDPLPVLDSYSGKREDDDNDISVNQFFDQ